MISAITSLSAPDIVITLGMLGLLALSAWCDANGAEVYDETTVPYALLGIIFGFRQGRLATSVVTTLILLFVLQSWRPKWLLKLNSWFMRRAYRATAPQEMEREEEALNERADSFAQQNARPIIVVGTAIFFAVASMVVFSHDGVPKAVVAMTCVLISAYEVLLLFRVCRRHEASQEHEGHEELTALGGADIIVFLGLLAYYGVIPFLFGVTASLLVFLAMAAFRIHGLKKGSIGLPLLPAMLYAAPIRFILAATVCRPIVESYMWLTTLYL